MSRTRITIFDAAARGLYQKLKGWLAHFADPEETDDNYIDVFGDLQRLFEVPLTYQKAAETASEDIDFNIGYFPEAVKIKSVYVVPSAAVTADTTDYKVLKLTDGTNTIGSLKTDADAALATADQGYSMTLASSYVEVDAGTTLHLVSSTMGSGVVLPLCHVQVEVLHN